MEQSYMFTPERLSDSVTLLTNRRGWPKWFDDIVDSSKNLGVWSYVDPTKQLDPAVPVEPKAPTPPVLKPFSAREKYETDRAYELRGEREKNEQVLALRLYDNLSEKHRVDMESHRIKLLNYDTDTHNLRLLSNAIRATIADTYRAYLKLDKADTPRAMIKSLQSRIKPLKDSDQAAAVLQDLNTKLRSEPTGCIHDLLEDVALATVELHRLQGPKFDEHAVASNLARTLQKFDKSFAQSLPRKPGGEITATVLEIVEDFKYKMSTKDKSSGVDPESHTSSQLPPLSKRQSKSTNSGKKGNLARPTKKTCPGCKLQHVFPADAWWETCFVFLQLYELDGVPDFFELREEYLDRVEERLRFFPDELIRSREWLKEEYGDDSPWYSSPIVA
ncbi:hypothetical protein AAL_04238 [Moelleriella libera RCEF 2490]|uniref:Uncharacterized protein n=1 Tax=Moelleriella libera RCEF 2490 TaxID=1081109 RepID=A0A162ILS4_9HYPO|nr:hypothetical protein AAL_04238 [Moelleriella libera RCEF 2490]